MFCYTFQITKKIIFEVSNDRYFATSAAEFNRPKTDFNMCGQCQDAALPDGAARTFWEKWDTKHLSHLNAEDEQELMKDIDVLKEKYNWCTGCNFTDQKELSKKEPKK